MMLWLEKKKRVRLVYSSSAKQLLSHVIVPRFEVKASRVLFSLHLITTDSIDRSYLPILAAADEPAASLRAFPCLLSIVLTGR